MSHLLDLDITLHRPTLALAARLSLTQPWTCLFGASGSGKSTLLRLIAGLDRPATGRIVLEQTTLFDARQRICLPPHRRPIRMAPQRTWIFPGTVRANLLYGVRPGGAAQADSLLEVLDLHALRDAPAARLSGGEQQRVSVARALAAALYGPVPTRLLLLDEPCNGMDAARRDPLLRSLRALLAEAALPVLSVTHDLSEVFLLDADVIRLADGKVLAQGPARDVLADERLRLLETLTTKPDGRQA